MNKKKASEKHVKINVDDQVTASEMDEISEELAFCKRRNKEYCFVKREALRKMLIGVHLHVRTIAEQKAELEWWGTLVERAQIGTKETPSLRAYIEQLEAQVKGKKK